MYIECNCLLNSLITLLFFFSKSLNTVTKISKFLLKYSHFMKVAYIKICTNKKCNPNYEAREVYVKYF